MSDEIIKIPSYLIEESQIGTSSYCGQCEVVIESCGSCESCQTTCQKSCQTTCEKNCQYSWETCGNCEVVCMNCQSSEGCCMDDCENFCMGGCQICESTSQTLVPLPDPYLLTGLTTITENSIQITIEAVTGADTYYARINGGNQQSSSNRTFTFIGLTPDAQYLIEIKVSGAGYADSNWVPYNIITVIPWEWQNPKTDKGNFNLTATEWTAFCNKINKIRVLKGLTNYNFTLNPEYISKDKPFYAWIWLQAANAINDLGTGVATECLSVVSGDDIYAWYFDNLKTALNNAISSLTP